MSPSLLRLAADAIVAVHAAFVVYVMLGGVLALRWPRMAWAHAPAAIWGIAIEFSGWTCPLTPIENQLRQRSGSAGNEGDFIEHYVLPLLYRADLTRTCKVRVWNPRVGSTGVGLCEPVLANESDSRRHRRKDPGHAAHLRTPRSHKLK